MSPIPTPPPIVILAAMALIVGATQLTHQRAASLRRRVITRPAAPTPVIGHRAVRAVWRPARPDWPGPLATPLLRWPWNLLHRIAARTCPKPRPSLTRRALRAVWLGFAAGLLTTAVGLAVVAILVWPLWWLATTIAATVLVVAGWTPPAVYDPNDVDPDRALFSDDHEHQPPPPARPPGTGPPPTAPEPLSLHERQVAAAETHAAAMHRIALTEATRPTPAPATPTGQWITVPQRPLGPTLIGIATVVLAAYALFVVILIAGAANYANQHPTDPTAPVVQEADQ